MMKIGDIYKIVMRKKTLIVIPRAEDIKINVGGFESEKKKIQNFIKSKQKQKL